MATRQQPLASSTVSGPEGSRAAGSAVPTCRAAGRLSGCGGLRLLYAVGLTRTAAGGSNAAHGNGLTASARVARIARARRYAGAVAGQFGPRLGALHARTSHRPVRGLAGWSRRLRNLDACIAHVLRPGHSNLARMCRPPPPPGRGFTCWCCRHGLRPDRLERRRSGSTLPRGAPTRVSLASVIAASRPGRRVPHPDNEVPAHRSDPGAAHALGHMAGAATGPRSPRSRRAGPTCHPTSTEDAFTVPGVTGPPPPIRRPGALALALALAGPTLPGSRLDPLRRQPPRAPHTMRAAANLGRSKPLRHPRRLPEFGGSWAGTQCVQRQRAVARFTPHSDGPGDEPVPLRPRNPQAATRR